MNSISVAHEGAARTTHGGQPINEIHWRIGCIHGLPSKLSWVSRTVGVVKLTQNSAITRYPRLERFVSHRWLDPIKPTTTKTKTIKKNAKLNQQK